MEDPRPQFSYLVEQFKERLPDLAYLHTVGTAAMMNEGPEEEKVRVPIPPATRRDQLNLCRSRTRRSSTRSGSRAP